jgi:hypothetical protein
MGGIWGEGQNNNWVGKSTEIVGGMFSSLMSILGNVAKFVWDGLKGMLGMKDSNEPRQHYTPAAPPPIAPTTVISDPEHGVPRRHVARPSYQSRW